MANLVGEELERKRSDTAPDVIFVLNPETNLPQDITGFTYRLTLNTLRDPTPANPGTELASIVGTIADLPSARVEFPWNDAQADQDAGTYYYDIEQTDAASKRKTIAKNKYRFYEDITKN